MEHLLIVKPSIHSWSAQKVNKVAGNEYNASVGASGANQVISKLLPKTFLKDWQQTAMRLRQETRRLSAFVYEDGWYAFTNRGFEVYRDKVWQAYSDRLEEIKIDMVQRYDVMRQHQLDKMGRTPNVQTMYPSVEWFKSRFSARLRVNTITPPKNLNELFEQDRKAMQAEYEQQLQEAKQALFNQLEQQLKDMLERINDPEALKNMRSAAWKNFDQFLDELPLKVLDDKDPILQLRDQIRSKIGNKLPDDFKDDLPAQRNVKQASKDALKAIEDIKILQL